jgi:hypothetical protein
MQKNMLTKQKNDIIKEIEKIKKEKSLLIKNINSINIKNSKIINSERREKKIIENLKKENEELEKEYNRIKDDYQFLVLESINLKETYEKENKSKNKVNMSTISANSSMIGYQISPEEYEEYDILRKNKDENDALIMQLKSNNEAQELEINELKEKIKLIKKRKNMQ